MSTGWIIATVAGSVVAMIIAADVAYRLWITSRIRGLIDNVPAFGVIETGPARDHDNVQIPSDDGQKLAASIYQPAGSALGLVVFCHELHGCRETATKYVEAAIDAGYVVLSFDFCNHGDSFHHPDYHPIQWVTEAEISDLNCVIDWARNQAEFCKLKLALFGVSRGGCASLIAASQRTDVSAVITDSGYSTQSLIHAFTDRFSRHICPAWIFDRLPRWHVRQDINAAIRSSERRNGVSYVHLENTVSRLNEGVLMIVGSRDSYVTSAVREQMRTMMPNASYWQVPKAKHNGSRGVARGDYDSRIVNHLQDHLVETESVQAI